MQANLSSSLLSNLVLFSSDLGYNLGSLAWPCVLDVHAAGWCKYDVLARVLWPLVCECVFSEIGLS